MAARVSAFGISPERAIPENRSRTSAHTAAGKRPIRVAVAACSVATFATLTDEGIDRPTAA